MSNNNFLKQIKIRDMVSGDEGLVNEFFDAMGPESRAFFNRTDYNRNGALRYCKNPDSTRRFWIAEYEGKMAGYVFFLEYNTSIPVLGIAVRDDLKGLHLGTTLINFAINHIKEAGKGGIQLTTVFANVRAQMLYEKMGFKCMGQYKNGQEFFYLYRFTD